MNLGILHFTDKKKANLYSQLWSETMNELDEETKKYVLQHIKLEIEGIMGEQVKYIRGFEELRFQLMDQPNILCPGRSLPESWPCTSDTNRNS